MCEGDIDQGAEYPEHSINRCRPFEISVRSPGYQWSLPRACKKEVGEVIDLTMLDSKERPLNLSLEMTTTSTGMRKLVIFAKYWFINRTGLRLLYCPRYASKSCCHFHFSLAVGISGTFDRDKTAAGQSQSENEEVILARDPSDWYLEDDW